MAKAVLLSFTLLAMRVRGEDKVIDSEACSALGFNEDLECVSCNKLSEFDLDDLQPECMGCCMGSADQSISQTKKYPKARLDICNWKLGAFPQMEPFVKGDKVDRFKNLETRNVRGQPPRLFMLNADGETEEELNVESWDTPSLEEYLSERLEE